MQSHNKHKTTCTGQYTRRVKHELGAAALIFSLLVTYATFAPAKDEISLAEPFATVHIWRDDFPQLIQVGEGVMTWFGFSIYRASLWSHNGRYESLTRSRPLALHITYEKNISRDKLIETTLDQWSRLNISNKSQRDVWARKLRRIWPDVKPGDSITTVLNLQGHTEFFNNARQLETITDTEFGPALLSIWLHPKTTASDLRAKLIGIQKG